MSEEAPIIRTADLLDQLVSVAQEKLCWFTHWRRAGLLFQSINRVVYLQPHIR